MSGNREYIDREAVLCVIKELFERSDPVGEEQLGILKIHRVVREHPASDVAPVVHEEWDETKYPFCNVCPRCGVVIDRTCIKSNSGKLNYCPNCGAVMKKGDGE